MKKFLFSTSKFLLILLFSLASVAGWGQTTDLFISEYVEGSSNNKYIEIYNGTGSAVDLSNYRLRLYANGGTSTTSDVQLSGTLANGSVIVYKNSSAALTLPSGVTAIDNVAVAFNGDDALALYKISTATNVDIFGRIGSDPGSAWTATGGYTTENKTLRRKSVVCGGITVNPTGTGVGAFTTLSTEWDMFDTDVVDDLGSHTAICSADVTAPTLSTLSPLDNATNIPINTNLALTFNENVKAGTGNLTIKRISDGVAVETINITSGAVTFSGATATINPPTDLAYNTDYYIEVDNTAITDMAGNAFAGISGNTAWNFKTAVQTYILTVTQPTGGSITPGTTTVNEGANQIFTHTANSCYTFNNWVIDGANGGTASTYSFSNVTAKHTIAVSETLKTNTITASAGVNGSISPSGATSINCGSNQTYTITPNSGYVVDEVLVDGVSVAVVSTYTFNNVIAAHTISVTFKVYVGPCLSEDFAAGTKPSDWIDSSTGISYLSNYADISANTGYVTMVSVANASSLTFDLSRTSNTTAKKLDIEVSTTSQSSGFTAIDSYNHSNTTSAGTTPITIDLSAYSSSPIVYIRFNKTSGNTSPWRIDNVKVFCAPSIPTVTQPTDYFRSKASGNWTANSTWESSHDGSTNWVDADRYPGAVASGVQIRNPNIVTINNNQVKITNTQVFGAIEVTNFNFSVDGDEEIELVIKDGGEFIVNGNGYKNSGSSYGLVETDGKVIARNLPNNTGAGSDFVQDYLDADYGLFNFGNGGICEWDCTTTTLGTSGFPTIFAPYAMDDLAILRFTAEPPSTYTMGSTGTNLFNAFLELTNGIEINIAGTGSKTFVGGIRGNGIVDVISGGNINLGTSTVIPELGGSVLLKIPTAKLKLPNGANVTTGANFVIQRNDATTENGTIDREGGTININGTLDITNMRITNTATGGVSVNNGGTLKTRHTLGLYGTNTAIPSGTLTINDNSTIEYYADVNQKISTGVTYYNVVFSGSGGVKSPSSITAVNIHTDGKVTITGNPTVNFSATNLASTAANNTKFDMDGGRLILGTAELLPNMRGTYNITGGTIEFTNNATGIRTPNTYHNIVISVPANKEVIYAGGTLTLNNNATVLVKTNATLTSTNGNASMVGTSGNTLTLEPGATFKTAVIPGFYGASGGFGNPSASVRDNITLDLQPGSIVAYARLSGTGGLPAGATSGEQTITPLTSGYPNLHITGDGVKTAKGDITVKEITKLNSAPATLWVPAYSAADGYSNFYAQGGIDNTTGDSGAFILGNDANLMQNVSAVNTNAKIEARRLMTWSDSDRKEYNFLSSPVADQNMRLLFGEASNTLFATVLKESTNLFVNATQTDYETEGKGFAVKEAKTSYTGEEGVAANEGQYKGRPNNGDISIEVTRSAIGRGWNLVGNPYPSNLDLYQVYIDNSGNIESAEFRFWDNRVNNTYVQYGGAYKGYSYAIYNAGSDEGNPAPGGDAGNNENGGIENTETAGEYRFAKVSQGFMIRAVAASANLNFNNNQRVTTQPSRGFFGKTEIQKDRYRLQLITPEELYLTQTVVYYNGGDNAYGLGDSKHPSTSASDKFYSYAGDQKAIINGRSPFADSDVVVLGNKHFVSGVYKIRAIDKVGVFANGQKIYLKDKELNTITDLTAGDYIFTSDSGDYTNRFEIVYKPGTVLGTESSAKENIIVYRDGMDFVVKSSDKTIENVELYDATGRLLFVLKGSNKELRFSSERLVDGMYVLKAQLKGGEQLTKKIRK